MNSLRLTRPLPPPLPEREGKAEHGEHLEASALQVVRHSSIKKQDLKPHDLRCTFGTWFLQANPGHVRELAELMGRSDLSQVMKYALSDEQRARAGVARL